MRTPRLLLCLLLAGLPLLSATAQQGDGSPAMARAHLLHRGVNASMWFAQAHDYSPARLRSYTTTDDIATMHRVGFDHVRLSVDGDELLRTAAPGGLNTVFIAELDRVVQAMLQNGLRVIVDVHPSDEFKQQLRTSDASAARFIDLWTALAGHFASSDPEKVFFEVLNEPEFADAEAWAAVQARAVAAIRHMAPRHTIIATARNYSGLPDLLTLEPLADNNVIYTFHDYEPFAFTHQGATWTTDKVRPLHGVPYPSTPEDIAPVLPQEAQLSNQYWLNNYGLDRWDAARIRAELGYAAKWGALHHVPVYCGEFGVYRRFADPAMRAQWLKDTRSALEAEGIGWAVWDYQGSFAVMNIDSGKPQPDPAIAAALGLQAQ